MSQYKERLVREWRKHGGLIIACDFDDTISPFHFKEPADMGRYARTISLLKDCIRAGCTIVIFTARSEDKHPEVLEYCANVGLEVAGVNINLPGLPYGNHKKIYANIYLDDRAGLDLALDNLHSAYVAIIEERAAKSEDDWLNSVKPSE